MSNPLYLEPVIGYRSWWAHRDTYSLNGRITQSPWASEEKTTAYCDQVSAFWRGKHDSSYILPPDHEVPHEDCSCGLYAFHRLPDAIRDYGGGPCGIVGAAVFWGEIVVHTAGFKAQYGRPIALVDHRKRDRPDDIGWPTILENVIQRYNIPVLPYDLLEDYAKTFGTQLGVEYFGE